MDYIKSYFRKSDENDKKKEYCIVCLQQKECATMFLNLSFCDKCDEHLYNGDIDLEKSKKNNNIVWTIEREELFGKDIRMTKTKEYIVKSKYKLDKILQKIENNEEDDVETDVRDTLRELQYAFYFISR